MSLLRKITSIAAILMLSSQYSYAGLIDNTLSLKSVDESLTENSKKASKLKSKLKLNYLQTTFLEHDPLLFQHKTQFAQTEQNNLQLIQQYKRFQDSTTQPINKRTENNQDLYNTSTLSPQIIAMVNNNGLYSEQGLQDDYSDTASNDQDNQSFRTSLDSNDYNNAWVRISQSQQSRQSLWNKTQSLKQQAESVTDLQRRHVKAENNLTLVNVRNRPRYNYSAPNHRFSRNITQSSWVNKMMPRLTKRMPDPTQRKVMLNKIYEQSAKHKLKPDLILALIQIESNFRPSVDSHAGAQGLMQVMPFWKKEIGQTSDNLYDITTNIEYGVRILKHYLNVEKGSLVPALARYNGSYGKAKYPNKVIGAWLKNWHSI